MQLEEQNDQPNKVGRPTAYKPEYAEQAAKLCALGATDDELADFFEVTQRTINRWKITHPDFCQSLQRAKDAWDDRIERSLFMRASGHTVTEQQAFKVKTVTYDDGKRSAETEEIKIVDVERYQPPDTAAQIFWLKNRRGKDWKDRQQVDLNHTLTLGQEFHQFVKALSHDEAPALELTAEEVDAPESTDG